MNHFDFFKTVSEVKYNNSSIIFSKDNKWLLVGGYSEIRIYNNISHHLD